MEEEAKQKNNYRPIKHSREACVFCENCCSFYNYASLRDVNYCSKLDIRCSSKKTCDQFKPCQKELDYRGKVKPKL